MPQNPTSGPLAISLMRDAGYEQVTEV